MPPTVSVIIATYNYGSYLPAALDSVLAQTFTDWEAIIVDDASTDNTSEVVRPYLSDARVRYHRTDHLGAAGARNVAIGLARGSFLAILDADDRWLPGKLARQMGLFRDNPELGVVYTRRLIADEQGHVLRACQEELCRGQVLSRLFLLNFVCFSSAVIARQALERIGLFDTRCEPSEDYDLLLRIGAYYPFDYIDEPLVVYRMHDALQRDEIRCHVVLGIRRRSLDERGGREVITPAAVRRAYAQTYALLAMAAVRRSRLSGVRWAMRALATYPLSAVVWEALRGAASQTDSPYRTKLARPCPWPQATSPCSR